jgi:hypothetical protein
MGDKMQTALIVVAMQNAFCHPEGSFKKRGYKIINLDQVIYILQYIQYNYTPSFPMFPMEQMEQVEQVETTEKNILIY